MDQDEQVTTDAEGGIYLQPSIPPQYQMLFVQSIRGAPASVLIALAVTGRHMSHQELQLWTRCGHRQVTAALRILEALGWIKARTTRGPWSLLDFRGLALRRLFEEGSALRALGGGGDSLNPLEGETSVPSALRGQLVEAMYDGGIREPTASELVELPHMNLDYLCAHLEGARACGLGVGAAIEAMRVGAPPPQRPAPKDRQAEVEDKIRRFMEGS